MVVSSKNVKKDGNILKKVIIINHFIISLNEWITMDGQRATTLKG